MRILNCWVDWILPVWPHGGGCVKVWRADVNVLPLEDSLVLGRLPLQTHCILADDGLSNLKILKLNQAIFPMRVGPNSFWRSLIQIQQFYMEYKIQFRRYLSFAGLSNLSLINSMRQSSSVRDSRTTSFPGDPDGPVAVWGKFSQYFNIQVLHVSHVSHVM